MWTRSLNSEKYLKTSRTSIMELFHKNSYWLKSGKYFRQKVQSYMFNCVLNTPLQIDLTICKTADISKSDVISVLPTVHTLSGCDSTSKIGDKTPLESS